VRRCVATATTAAAAATTATAEGVIAAPPALFADVDLERLFKIANRAFDVGCARAFGALLVNEAETCLCGV